MTIQQDPLFIEVQEDVERFRSRVFERIEKVHQKQKACKIKNVIETKVLQEMKLNAELKAQLAKLTERCDGLDKICTSFKSGLTISDGDQNRLDNAKEMYEIGKKLTGIRFDFSAPSNVAKGYIKYEKQRLLSPFELPAGDSDALWRLLEEAVGSKENLPPNLA